MSLFKDMLGANESLFKNEVALDFSFQPKLLKYRETQQRQVAECIKPLFQNRNGRNIFIYGVPGIGKTLACRHVIGELEEDKLNEGKKKCTISFGLGKGSYATLAVKSMTAGL